MSSIETAPLEMERLAAQSRTKDPLCFFTASWSLGKKPTIEQARAAADTSHEVAFSLADAQTAVMERVNDKAQHQPTLEAILAGAVPFGERSRDKVALDDFAVRDLAAEQREA